MYLLRLLLISLFICGCSRVPPVDDGFVSQTISERIDSSVAWRQGYEQEEQVLCFIESAISHELSADTAIQIALLNNPKVQALFEEIGMARADLVEAGLLSNPTYEVEVRYPYVKHLKTNIEYLITSSILDIFLIPLRTRLANTEFEQIKLRVSKQILDLAFDVRRVYYELIAERKKIQYIRSQVELTSISSDISTKQLAVGNVNALEFQRSQAQLLEAELNLSQSQAKMIRLSEEMNRLLGFSQEICFILPETLPEKGYLAFDLCSLESLAIEERLDLQVARFEVMRICQMLGLKDWWTYTNLRAGLAGEREPDGANVLGFGITGQIPIFNYGQAARMRLYAQLRQAQNHLAELEIRALSEVREAYHLSMAYLKILNDYQERLLPMQSKITASSEELYNVMGLGVDKLLEYKQQQLFVSQNYVESLKNYLVAKVELNRALQGNLLE